MSTKQKNRHEKNAITHVIDELIACSEILNDLGGYGDESAACLDAINKIVKKYKLRKEANEGEN